MNLLEMLKSEVKSLKTDNKYKIARYLYIRTGEIFNYDPLYVFSCEEKKDVIRKKRIDIRNVTNFNIVCFSWVYIYAELLENFKIDYQIIMNDQHAAVIVKIDEKNFLADLTNRNIDISRVKYGTKIQNFYQISRYSNEKKYSFEQIDREIYNKGVQLERVIGGLRNKTSILKKQMSLGEYNYFILRLIQNIVNVPRDNVGFMSGIIFISDLLKEFEVSHYAFHNVHFFDIDSQVFIDVYETQIDGNRRYFAYQMYHDGYRLREASEEDIRFFSNNYSSNENSNLVNNSFVKSIKKL